MRGDPPAGGADEHGLQGAGQRSAAAERFALAEDGGDGLQEFAAAGCGKSAQGGEVAGEPQGLGGLAGAGGVPGAAQLPAEPGEGDGGRLPDPRGVAAGFQDGLLPEGVPDSGGVAGAGVQQVEGVRHEGGDGPLPVRDGLAGPARGGGTGIGRTGCARAGRPSGAGGRRTGCARAGRVAGTGMPRTGRVRGRRLAGARGRRRGRADAGRGVAAGTGRVRGGRLGGRDGSAVPGSRHGRGAHGVGARAGCGASFGPGPRSASRVRPEGRDGAGGGIGIVIGRIGIGIGIGIGRIHCGGGAGERRGVERADDRGHPVARRDGVRDHAPHVCLAGQVRRRDGGRVRAQRPADAEGRPPYGVRGAARCENLDGTVPQVVAVAAGPGRRERIRERTPPRFRLRPGRQLRVRTGAGIPDPSHDSVRPRSRAGVRAGARARGRVRHRTRHRCRAGGRGRVRARSPGRPSRQGRGRTRSRTGSRTGARRRVRSPRPAGSLGRV